MVTNDLYGKPFQLKFVRPAQMLLFANAVCDPPLGQATVIPHGQTVRFSIKLCGYGILNFPQVKFTVLLESSKSFPEQPWEAVLWHNGHENRDWRELPLQEQDAAISPVLLIRQFFLEIH